MVSQKCQYAIRAVFELAKRRGDGPVKIFDIAEKQAIPLRFLEVILNQLKQAGFVQSRRGASGGYLLLENPKNISVGEIIRFVEGPLVPVPCLTDKLDIPCAMDKSCAFIDMWKQAATAVSSVYDQTSFQDLVDRDPKNSTTACLTYAI
jgi:Rrf2 family transcriptional regulator, cysteine metabolism repressor